MAKTTNAKDKKKSTAKRASAQVKGPAKKRTLPKAAATAKAAPTATKRRSPAKATAAATNEKNPAKAVPPSKRRGLAKTKTISEAWADDVYAKLSAILASQERLGSYPPTVGRLLKLADLPWPGEAAFASPRAAEHFLITAAGRAKKQAVLDALVFLPEHLSRIAGYAPALRYFIERCLGGKKAQSCSIAQILKVGYGRATSEALKRQLVERLAERRLPPGIGALQVGTTKQLFLFDQIIGSPAEPPASIPAALVADSPRVGGSTTRSPETILGSGGRQAESRPSDNEQAESRPSDNEQAESRPSDNEQAESRPSDNEQTETRPSDDAVPPVGVSTDDPALADLMQNAFDRLDARSGCNNQVLLYDLRDEVHVPREQFDACIDGLRRNGVFTLSAEEGRFGRLSPEEVDGGIEGPSGRLVYVARR